MGAPPKTTGTHRPVPRPIDLPEGGHYASTNAEKLNAEYAYNWTVANIKEKFITQAAGYAKQLFDNKIRYQSVSRQFGAMPWWFVAIIHQMEASQNFLGALHNGDKIIGKGTKTTHVPEGRGPFDTWEEGAIDALKGYRNFTDWSLPSCLRRMESYNGLGYRTGAGSKSTPPNASAYTYAGTQFFIKGKYVEDHQFDIDREDSRPGCIAILIALTQVDPSLAHLRTVGPVVDDKPGEVPEGNLLSLAKSVGQEQAVARLLEYRNSHRSESRPNHWAVVDFSIHSSKPRMFIFDIKANKVHKHLCAHGSGSEGAKDDGRPAKFSNVSGSGCSSLGIYLCAESYRGNHGLSLRLDGLEAANNNARERAVVIHGADYVSQGTINDTGRIGRSLGCPAVPNEVSAEVVRQLEGGSLLIIHAPTVSAT